MELGFINFPTSSIKILFTQIQLKENPVLNLFKTGFLISEINSFIQIYTRLQSKSE